MNSPSANESDNDAKLSATFVIVSPSPPNASLPNVSASVSSPSTSVPMADETRCMRDFSAARSASNAACRAAAAAFASAFAAAWSAAAVLVSPVNVFSPDTTFVSAFFRLVSAALMFSTAVVAAAMPLFSTSILPAFNAV